MRQLGTGSILLLALVLAAPGRADVTVTFDRPTLNELLPALSVNEIALPVAEGQTLGVFLEELQVVGFEPAAEGKGSGYILTSLRLRVPQLGLDLPVEPRLSLHIVEASHGDELELRFEQADIAIPLLGRIDVARFLPPLRFPAENVFGVDGVRGNVEVRSHLTRIEMEPTILRLFFHLATVGKD